MRPIPAFTLLALSAAAPLAAAPPSDKRILAAAAAAKPGEIALLKRVVEIDSGTGDAAGAGKVQAVVAQELRALGGMVTMHAPEAAGLGENLVARFEGTGRGRILLIGHIDTVYAAGTLAARPWRVEGDRIVAPGVADEKGGVVQAVAALGLLKQLGVRDYRSITLLVETSEETGSPGTRRLIAELLRDADVELNLEPGDAPDAITVWRKGSSYVRVKVRGRAAHAGVAPQLGRNAAVELIHQLRALDPLPKTGDGLTANLTTLATGNRPNVIPELATAEINVRVRRSEQLDTVLDAFRTAAKTTEVPDTTVEISSETSFPPLPDNPATMRLAERAKAIYADTGRPLAFGGNGGASQSALAHAAGVPALDGLGPVGGNFHSEGEWLDMRSLTPRLYLLTKLLIDYGANPPAK